MPGHFPGKMAAEPSTHPSRQGGRCPLCGSGDRTLLITAFDRLYPRAENFDYVECADCGMVCLSPMPEPETIAEYYGTDYNPHADVDPERIRRRLHRPLNRFLIHAHLRTSSPRSGPMNGWARLLCRFAMAHTLAPHGTCRLLEVGCGSGSWLFRHRLLGWSTQGVEPNPQACRKARSLGLPVHEGDLSSFPGDGLYDVIAFRSVLEHVPNPLETLKCAAALLAPGGDIMISVPNIDSWSFRQFGIAWYPLDPPRHVLQFTPLTLTRLGARANLRVIGIGTEVNPRMILNSRRYAQAFPADILSRTDLRVRQDLIEQALQRGRLQRTEDRWYERIAGWRARLWGGPCGGEMIHAIFEIA